MRNTIIEKAFGSMIFEWYDINDIWMIFEMIFEKRNSNARIFGRWYSKIHKAGFSTTSEEIRVMSLSLNSIVHSGQWIWTRNRTAGFQAMRKVLWLGRLISSISPTILTCRVLQYLLLDNLHISLSKQIRKCQSSVNVTGPPSISSLALGMSARPIRMRNRTRVPETDRFQGILANHVWSHWTNQNVPPLRPSQIRHCKFPAEDLNCT